VGLALVALAELCTPALRAAATRAAPAPVAPLLPRAAVGIGPRIEGFDVLGLEVLIHVSVVVPAEEHVIAASWRPQTRKRASHL
jgi:hypothetical protein